MEFKVSMSLELDKITLKLKFYYQSSEARTCGCLKPGSQAYEL